METVFLIVRDHWLSLLIGLLILFMLLHFIKSLVKAALVILLIAGAILFVSRLF